MLHSDQQSWRAPEGAFGLSGAAEDHGGALRVLAREIEETQRRQGETLAHIVDRLRTLDAQAARSASAAGHPATGRAPSDEPWDPASAEALMQSCEDNDIASRFSRFAGGSLSHHQEWMGERFQDVTQRIKRALADLKPGTTMALLEQRLDQFQRHIGSALEDVVRRADLDGLRAIEAHVGDLGDKLDALERHVSRLDGIEADLRSVMDQVSDERIARLLDYDSRFAADLEAVAVRAAEELHARLGHDDARVQADARRHEELRALIETSIQDRRQAEADAASLVNGLSGRVDAQADRYDEIKALLEQAIQEQRHNEQTAFGMLDTLQQALVRVLDRMDSLEQHHAAAHEAGLRASAPTMPEPQAGDDVAFGVAASFARFAAAPAYAPAAPSQDYAHAPIEDHYAGASATDMAPPAQAPLPASPIDAPHGAFQSGSLVPQEPAGDTTVDRLRRDFIADARRAKLKAAANRAEAVAEAAPPTKLNAIESARAALSRTARQTSAPAPAGGGAGRFLGTSPKLLAGALALVVAINGGLLLFGKSAPPAVPEITIQSGSGAGEAAPDGDGSPAGTPGPRSELNADGHDFAQAAPTVETLPAAEAPLVTPYGLMDDILAPPPLDTTATGGPAAVPRGMTVANPRPLPDDVVADVYERQVLAGLSGKLGALAAGHTPDDLLPEKAGRIAAAYSDGEALAAVQDGDAQGSALDLPPATVGPLSLRLAAANGDASAEFEVAARLAEGKGTSQDFSEALRWYQRSATKGFAQSQYRLGTLYERGLGVGKDVNRARVWYSRAAEQGNVKAMHNLAVLSAGGEAGEPDYAGAMKWFVKAAEHGLADSQYNLAVLLENGLGVKADRVTALKWYALAAEGGDTDAVARRDALRASLGPAEVGAADKQIAAFKPRRAAPLANDARAAGEDWKKRVNADTNG